MNTEDAMVLKSGWLDVNPHPWRRYFARVFDTTVYGTLYLVVLGMIVSFFDHEQMIQFPNFSDYTNRFIDIILTGFLVIFFNTISIALTGTTLGKWIFGVKIIDEQNNSIDAFRALKREVIVWVKGMGFYIPIVSIVTMMIANSELSLKKTTSWDRKMNLKVKYRRSRFQKLYTIMGIIICLFLFFLLKIIELNTKSF